MNIKEAKKQIKNSMIAYFSKDEYGNYEIPIEKQRPVFLMGPPGIGKTAIMEQIASEMGVAMLSYSMTHHTRQSALGLPKLKTKIYDGVEYEVSEYTMSEIIASVYEVMEKSGLREGILFLDEINCVSETLTPVMLQFLQYKVFGKHSIPKGWIVVTAGNPPEYNKSVKGFDIVTWDRLKRIDIEPDYDAWKEYAYETGVHPSVLTYLEIEKDDFYKVESTVDGQQFVTARGWDDLSKMIYLYEKHGISVDLELVSQYIQNNAVAKSFAAYYELFNKYKSDYQISKILEGGADEAIIKRAKDSGFDERISLLGLMLDAVFNEIHNAQKSDELVNDIMECLKQYRLESKNPRLCPGDILTSIISKRSESLSRKKEAKSISYEEEKAGFKLILMLNELLECVRDITDKELAFKEMKKAVDKRVMEMKNASIQTKDKLENMFQFTSDAFGAGQEVLILVTELTANKDSALFISRYGCDAYYEYNKQFQFYERGQDILKRIDL